MQWWEIVLIVLGSLVALYLVVHVVAWLLIVSIFKSFFDN